MFRTQKTNVAAVAVKSLVGLLLLAACERQTPPTEPVTQTFAPAANRTSLLVTNGSLIQLVDVKRPPGVPNTINPCWFLNRGLYESALRTGGLRVDFAFAYRSRGRVAVRTFTVDPRDARPEDDDEAGERFVELTIPLDLGDAIPDADSPIDAVALLVETNGARPVLLGASHLVTRP